MLASQALRSCSRLEHALAYRSRNASLSSRCSDLLRKPFSLAQGSSKLSPFAAALALLFALENNFGSSKAAAKQVVSVSERQRRAAQALACICVICGFPHVSRAWKYMIIQFTSKAQVLFFIRVDSRVCIF